MITEDYCSFEVAKLLKKKGFDELCIFKYNSEGVRMKAGVAIDEWQNSELDDDECSCVSHQMAMKWLREVHNIMVSPYALSLGYYFEIVDLTTRDITGCKPLYQVGIPSKEYILSTYEEAVEAGIKYYLEFHDIP
jgi:hypothetical protein